MKKHLIIIEPIMFTDEELNKRLCCSMIEDIKRRITGILNIKWEIQHAEDQKVEQ